MRKKKILTGLNISTGRITCGICSIDDNGAIRVLGSASSQAKGVKKGAVSDLSEAASSIAQAVEKAEAMAHTKVVSLIVNYDGPNIRSYNTKGSITIADKENEITKRDIERVIQAAETIALPFDRKIIHSTIRGFILDGQEGIKDPTGMYGTRLELDMQIVAGLITNIQNINRAINMAGFESEDIVLSALAAGKATLEDLEKDVGVVLVYISHPTTQIIVYNAGEIKSIEILPAGSGDFIESVAVNCNIPYEYAEDIIGRNANLDKAAATEEEKIILRVGKTQRSISKASVFAAIEPKAKDLIFDIGERLKNMPFAKEAASGCVVVGELSHLGGFLEMMELSLNMPVRMGLAKGFSGDITVINNPEYLTCLGLVKYWAKTGLRKKVRRNIFGNSPIGKLFNKANEIFSDYF